MLTGFAIGSKKVELNTDRALINLDLYIKDSPIGKYGNPESGLTGKTEDMLKEGVEVKKDEQAEAIGKEAGITATSEIHVEIHDRSITVNGVKSSDANEAFAKIKELYRVGLNVYLIDDYAEYQTYNAIYEKIKGASMTLIEVTND